MGKHIFADVCGQTYLLKSMFQSQRKYISPLKKNSAFYF